MAHRIINLNRSVMMFSPNVGYSRPVIASSQSSSIFEMIRAAKSVPCTIQIPGGVYNENLIVPDGVSLIGLGFVKVNEVTANGSGMVSCFECNKMSVNGKRVLNDCRVDVLNLLENTCVSAKSLSVKLVNCNKAQLIATNSTFGEYPNVTNIHAKNQSIIVIDSSTIEGLSAATDTSIIEMRGSAIVGQGDLFNIDSASTLQLFSSTVYGDTFVKTGPGTSIRAGIHALSDAIEFTGGENIKLKEV